MDSPKITVVTVCYNAEKEIEATMRSVLDQNYLNLEYILIDGASKDNTLDIIRVIKNEYSERNIIVLTEPDRGIYDAMNKGIDLASGEWINFMNVGDLFADADVLRDFFSMADTRSPNDILYGDVIYKYSFGSYYVDFHPGTDYTPFCHQATFSRVSLMKKMHFDLSYQIVADRNFLLQCQRAGSLYVYYPRVVAKFKRYGGLSTDARNWRKVKIETYRMEGRAKDWQYFCLVIGDFIQSHFHIRNPWVDVEARDLKKVESSVRSRKIVEENEKSIG